MSRASARLREADERRRGSAANPRVPEPVSPHAAAVLALQRGVGNAAVAKLMRLSKTQQKQVDEWQRQLISAAQDVDPKKPKTMFTDKFLTDHVRKGKTDEPSAEDLAHRSSERATTRFEPKAKELRERGAEREETAGTSSMVYFGPADLENMANDMQQWAGSRRGIYKVMEASAKRGQNDACGPWRKIGGAGGVGCEETTEHQYFVLTTSVHTKLDRQDAPARVCLKLGPVVDLLDRGKLTFKIHHFGGTA